MDYAASFAASYRRAWGAALAADDTARFVDPHDALDPANECEHGKLPADRVQVCTCWR